MCVFFLGQGMTIHMIKLCVGCESIDDLEQWIAHLSAENRARGRPDEQIHVTRSMPKKVDEVMEGGSLYWVIKGRIACRQPITDLRAIRTADGIERCGIVLASPVIPVAPRPCRPFQGWRYLEAKSAPADLGSGSSSEVALPEHLRRELADLGLL